MHNIIVHEWDEAKRRSNLAKHGLDFNDAYLIYENPDKVTLATAYSAEERWQDVAVVEAQGGTFVLV